MYIILYNNVYAPPEMVGTYHFWRCLRAIFSSQLNAMRLPRDDIILLYNNFETRKNDANTSARENIKREAYCYHQLPTDQFPTPMFTHRDFMLCI